MINGFIKGQALTLSSPVIASGTIDYLTARFTFFTNEWEQLDEIWVHFRQGDKVFDARVVDGRVSKDEHINLTEGEWSVYLHGNELVNGEVKARITTEPQTVKVIATGTLEGVPFPSVDASTGEKLLAIAKEAENKADKAIEAVADVQIQKGIQSVTAFPETAAEGDVVLFHRCNEISADDSNSGVVLDTAAIASLKLPEGITDRYWEFNAVNPTGNGFTLILEQTVIAGDEPYVLTGINLMTETFGGRWYWRDGKPYYDIPNATDEALPDYIPLGVVESFTATKDPLYGDDILDVEDTDNTTIFRTVPREYMYTGGEWKLTERTDEAEGSIISEVKPVVKDGQNFLELRLVDSRNFRAGKRTDFIYIPVAGVKDVTQQSGNVTLNGAEVILPKPEEKYVSMTKRETAASETSVLQANTFYSFGVVDTLALDFAEGIPNKVNEYLFSFISGETATVLTLPSSVKWVNELTVEANKRYEISVVDNVALWCAVDYEVTE